MTRVIFIAYGLYKHDWTSNRSKETNGVSYKHIMMIVVVYEAWAENFFFLEPHPIIRGMTPVFWKRDRTDGRRVLYSRALTAAMVQRRPPTRSRRDEKKSSHGRLPLKDKYVWTNTHTHKHLCFSFAEQLYR